VDRSQSMICHEEELDIVVAACDLGNPFVIIIDPSMVSFDAKRRVSVSKEVTVTMERYFLNLYLPQVSMCFCRYI
jgi:hypothetical protein